MRWFLFYVPSCFIVYRSWHIVYRENCFRKIADHPVDPAGLAVKSIVAQLEAHVEEDQEAGRQADGQSQYY
jgi:hypothetical protein